MNIERINSYQDPRFSPTVLQQHGCFLVDGIPCEVEIISRYGAIVRGCNKETYTELIEFFRFFTPHITRFFDENMTLIQEYPPYTLKRILLSDIQPSQFYVDKEKVKAIAGFVSDWENIVIPVLSYEGRYISLDGHTRLYYAVQQHREWVYGIEDTAGDSISAFAEEAIRRNIHSPRDLKLLEHEAYEKEWNQYCDNFFKGRT